MFASEFGVVYKSGLPFLHGLTLVLLLCKQNFQTSISPQPPHFEPFTKSQDVQYDAGKRMIQTIRSSSDQSRL